MWSTSSNFGLYLKELPKEIQCLLRIQEPVKVRLLREITDFGLGGHVPRGMTEDLDMALGGVQQPKQHLHGRRLTGAVGTEQAKDLSAPNLKINIVNRPGLRAPPKIAKDLRKPTHRHDDFIRRRRRTRAPGLCWIRSQWVHSLRFDGLDATKD